MPPTKTSKLPNHLVLESFLPYLLVNLSNQMSASLANVYRQDYALSVPQWRILANLHQFDELTSKQLVGYTQMDKVKVSRAIQSLIEDGLLTRVVHESDSRAFYVRLTRKGEGLMSRMVPSVLEWQTELLRGMSVKEQARVFSVVEKLSAQLKRMSAS